MQLCSGPETNILSVCLENTGIGALHIACQTVAVRAGRCLFDFQLRVEIRREKKTGAGRINPDNGRLYRIACPSLGCALSKVRTTVETPSFTAACT